MKENRIIKENILKFFEYCIYAVIIGAIVGFVGTGLGKIISKAVELFGGKCVLYFALCIIITYTLSGKYGLYSDQKLMENKFNID